MGRPATAKQHQQEKEPKMKKSSSSTSSLLETLLLAVLWLAVSTPSVASPSPTPHHLPKTTSTSFATSSGTFLAFVPQRSQPRISPEDIALLLRGGANGDDDTDVDELEEDGGEENDDADVAEVEDEADEEDSADEYDNEDDEEEDLVDTALVTSIKPKQKKTSGTTGKVTEYDEPYSMPMTMTLYATLLPIMISRKVDLYNPAIVRTLRYVFTIKLCVGRTYTCADSKTHAVPVVSRTPKISLCRSIDSSTSIHLLRANHGQIEKR